MVVLWYLLALAPFIVIAGLWLHYRRKQTERERAANKRWQQVLDKPSTAERTALPAELPGVVASAPRAQQALYQRRSRMLDPAHTLMFYLLRSGLHEHEVLVRVGLDRLLSLPTDVPDVEREWRQHAMAQQVVDFVVCDKAMQPVAAVDLLEGEAPAVLTTAPDFKTQCLAQSEIRYLCIPRTAMPKRDEVRALVLGVGVSARQQ